MAFFDPKKLLTNPLGVKPPATSVPPPVVLPKPTPKPAPLLQRVGNTITGVAKAVTNPVGTVATKAANAVVASPQVAAAFKARPDPSKALIAPANMDVVKKQVAKAQEEEALVQPQERVGKTISGGAGQLVGGPARAALQTFGLPIAEGLGLKSKDTPLMPQSDVGKFFLGEDPIYSIGNVGKQTAEKFAESKDTGQFVKNIGLGGLALGSIAADATPFGGEEKAVAKGLTSEVEGLATRYLAPKIAEFVDRPLLSNAKEVLDLGPAHPRTVELIKEAIGKDVSSFQHQMDGYAVKHSLKHGADTLPITKEDFALIPEIINNPDTITAGTKTKPGLDAITYSKRFNGTTLYVEEVREGKKTLNLKTMYKTKTPSSGEGVPFGVPLTSKGATLSAPESMGVVSSKAPKDGGVNPPQVESYVDQLMGKKGAGFFNVKKLNVPEPAKEAAAKEILNAGGQMAETVGRPLTHKEILAQADATSKILDKTVGREETADFIAQNLKLRQKLAADAAAGKTDEEFIRLTLAAKSQATDIARKLNSLKISADPKEVGAIEAILEAIHKQNKNVDEIVEAAKGVDFKDADQVTEFYRKFVQPKAGDWVSLLRYSSMLSSPKTHLINIVGNTVGSGIVAPIEKTLRGGVDALASAMTLGRRPRKYFAGEGVEHMKGYLGNVRAATQRFADTMSGKRMAQYLNESGKGISFDVQNIPLIPKGGGLRQKTLRAAEQTLSFPMRLLEAQDQFFSALTEGGAKRALQFREGKGAKVGGIDTKAIEEAAYRLFRQPTDVKAQGTLLKAIDGVTNLIHTARNSSNETVRTVAQFSLPFVRTPTNILKQGVEYSPLGFSTMLGAENKVEQFTKAIMGTAAFAGIGQLVGTGRLTWSEPTKQDEKNAFRAAGLQPYSVKIGDKWYSYAKLHPAVSFTVALSAALDDAKKNKGLTDSEADVVLSALAKWKNFFIDQSYVKSIGDLVSGVKGDENAFAGYFSNYAQQFVPFRALSSWVTRMVDPVQRRADPSGSVLEKQMEYLMMQIPGLSKKVPARTDQFGQEIPIQNPFLNAFSPVGVSTENKDVAPLYQDIQEAKVERANAVDAFQPTYEKIRGLITEGKTDEAQAALDALSDDDYKRYKQLKAKETAKTTSIDEGFVQKFYDIRDLVNAGKTDEAQAALDALTDEEYKLYKSLKAKLAPA